MKIQVVNWILVLISLPIIATEKSDRLRRQLHVLNTVIEEGSIESSTNPIYNDFDPDAELDDESFTESNKEAVDAESQTGFEKGYLTKVMRVLFPELESLPDGLTEKIKTEIDRSTLATGKANITEILSGLKRDSVLNHGGESERLTDDSEYRNYEGIYGWNADYRYENINRGDSKGVSTADENAAPAPRNTLFDELKSSVHSQVHGNKIMFTVTDSATSSGIKSKSLFSSGKADDFWIVASFVIPKDLGEEDWWLASIHDDKGVIQEGLKVLGSQKVIVYAASSPKGPQKVQIIGDAANGWDALFDGQSHQVAVQVTPRQVILYFNCERKGSNYLHGSRNLKGMTNIKVAKRMDGSNIPILFENLEIKSDENAVEDGICCVAQSDDSAFQCIIEGKNGFRRKALDLPPVEQKCEKGSRGGDGNDGKKGIDGKNGKIGISGAPGKIGPPGSDGLPGKDGQPGLAGHDGEKGSSGEKGRPGAIGQPGIQGISGEKGKPGDIGPQGPTGPIGITGPQGAEGFRGKNGSNGPRGQKGEIGPVGSKGDSGIEGLDGATGIPGLAGNSGFDGDKGSQGLSGPAGVLGIDGTPGIDGVKGNTGLQGEKGNTGPRGVAGISGSSNKGEPGPAGAAGIQGIIGDNGPKGYKGEPGDIGIKGVIGRKGITGPQGIQGKEGDKGQAGNQGKPGLTGSLGPVGIDGDAGSVGNSGPAGKPGNAGPAGHPGRTGPVGAPGKPGKTGKVGPVGPAGLKGSTGPAGFVGPQGTAGPTGQPGDTGKQGKSVSEPELQQMIRDIFQELIPTMIEPVRKQCEKCVDCRPSNQHLRRRMQTTGPPGEIGRPGHPGRPGTDGQRGQPGQQGPPGKPAEAGERGEPGEKGERGHSVSGAPGFPGLEGEIGSPGKCTAGKPGLKGEPGRVGPLGRNGPVGTAGPQGVCDNKDCTAPESWANQLRKYADRIYRKPLPPYSKGPPPSRNNPVLPAYRPGDIISKLPANPENSDFGPARPAETLKHSILNIPDDIIPHLKGPTGERHTVNLNNSPGLSRPAETYLMNPLVETTTSKKVKTTRKNTITTKTTTKKPKPTKKTTKSAKKPKPVVVKPNPKPSPGIKKPLTAKPKEVAPTVDKTCRKCQCRKSPESPNCSPSPCRSIPTICSARKNCPIRPANNRKRCVVRRINLSRHRRMQELLQSKRIALQKNSKLTKKAKRNANKKHKSKQ